MQRKVIFALIALGFGISMELVLALHIIVGSADYKHSSAQSLNGTIVPTVAIHYKKDATSLPEAKGSYPAPGEDLSGQEPGAEGDLMQSPEELTPPGAADPSGAYPASPSDSAPSDGAPSGGAPNDDRPDFDPGAGYPDEPPDYSYPPPENIETPTTAQPLSSETPLPPTATSEPTPTTTSPAPAATITVATPTTSASTTPSLTPSTNPTHPTESAPGNALVSAPAAEAPKIDGKSGDPAWANAPALVIDTSGGANHSAAQVSIRSVYDGENIYLLLTWSDPTQSFLLNPWERQKGGIWQKLTGADNRGGDENQYYMDKLALLWPIANSLPDFTKSGCAVACHSGAEAQVKATGLMYTGGPNQTADLWQWKSVVNVGQVDDNFLDDTHYSKDTPWAGFKGDPGSGGYTANQTKKRDAPAYMPPNGGDKSGAPGYILDSEKEKLDSSLFAPGDRVPGFLVAPFSGDRGDIQAGWSYNKGKWTLELKRKLVTGSSYDVQFDDLNKTYPFALATFDNSQVRHAAQNGAAILKFNK